MFHTMEEPWARREYYAHYMNTVRCTFSTTVHIDITGLRGALKERGLKAYPAQIHMLAAAVNQFREFRMGLGGDGTPGYWDVMHPSYTVFNPNSKTFASIWTEWDADFGRFYHAACADTALYSGSTNLQPQADMPENVFNISSIPWLDFTAFNLNVFGDGTYLPPIFTLGRYIEQGGKTLLPLAVQVHHAACDGYHAGLFVQTVRKLAAEYESWL